MEYFSKSWNLIRDKNNNKTKIKGILKFNATLNDVKIQTITHNDRPYLREIQTHKKT